MHRFFLSDTSLFPEHDVDLSSIAHQLLSVLRLDRGECILLLDNSGFEYRTEIVQLTRKEAHGRVLSKHLVTSEPWVYLTLYQSTLKADKFEWILQKGTEIGISRFVPVITERSIVRLPANIHKKRDRWCKIIQEAAEQSGRGRLPVLAQAHTLPEAIRGGSGIKILPWENAVGHRDGTRLEGVLANYTEDHCESIAQASLLIGPEGGLTPDEIALASGAQWKLVSLGPRILRSETAALVGATILMARLGELS